MIHLRHRHRRHRWHAFFRAAHDRHRQKILEFIKKHKKVNASQIVAHLGLSQPTISHHLKILKDAELIEAEKSGKEVEYSINDKCIVECCRGFMRTFCSHKSLKK